MSVLALTACALPRPWHAPTPEQACPTGDVQPGDALFVVSFRMPDCRDSQSPKWTYYRSEEAHYSTVGAASESSLIKRDDWLADLRKKVEKAGKPPVIYIHGYFNNQKDALDRALGIRALLCPRATTRTVQDARDCNPSRPVIALTWPSHNNFAKYTWDEANSEWVIDRAAAEIMAIARSYPGSILVAHSMGNRILVAAALKAAGEPNLFSQLILASPDVDREQMARLLQRNEGLGAPATIYASRRDQALSSSWRTHGYPRAGDLSNWVSGRRPGYPYRQFNRADVVDTTAVSAGPIAHAAFIQSDEGAADLCHVLAGDLTRPGREPDPLYSPYWVLVKRPAKPDDCRELGKAAARIAKGQ